MGTHLKSLKSNLQFSDNQTPSKMASGHSEEEWDSEAESTPVVKCPINKYSQEFATVGDYWRHVQKKDKLDMFKIFKLHSHHGYIRIINYLRRNAKNMKCKYPTTEELLAIYDKEICVNNDYLTKPVLEVDPFIIFSSDLDLNCSEDDALEAGCVYVR